MNELSMLVTITDRNTTKRFISLYESFGVNVTFSTVGSGTAAAKGTGASRAAKFLGTSLVNEKEMVFIVVRSDQKTAIMRAVMDQAGLHTKAQAIAFSLPVNAVAGMRLLEQED